MEKKNAIVAVKMIRIPPDFLDESMRQMLIQEINIMSRLKHPNIVQFLGASIDEENIYLVTEYIKGGSIMQQIKKDGYFDSKDVWKTSIDVAKGMDYLHKLQPPMIHRDLKPHNLLRSNSVTKITDFGSSASLIQDDRTMTYTVGTPQYTAPEVIKKKKI